MQRAQSSSDLRSIVDWFKPWSIPYLGPHWAKQKKCLTVFILYLLQGMVLTDPVQKPCACLGFWADVFLLFHTTSISKRFQATVYIGNVIQTAVIEEMNKVQEHNKCLSMFHLALRGRRWPYGLCLDPGSSGLGSSLGWGHSLCCVLKQDTFSHSAPLSTQVCKNVLKDC